MSDTTVLLIDDEEEFLDALAERLELRDIAVETAVNGKIALTKAERKAFDAVLLDMAMPGMDGLQTLKELLEINPIRRPDARAPDERWGRRVLHNRATSVCRSIGIRGGPPSCHVSALGREPTRFTQADGIIKNQREIRIFGNHNPSAADGVVGKPDGEVAASA